MGSKDPCAFRALSNLIFPSYSCVHALRAIIRYVRAKGKTFDYLTQEKADLLANHINSTKRDSLNGLSPFKLSQLLLDEKLLSVMNYHEIMPDDVMLTPELLK